MIMKSDAFQSGGAIPEKYSADGDDVSPPLSWDDVPAQTKSFALLVDDPDAPAGTWVHWVAWNIPADRRSLPERVERSPAIQAFIIQGKNDFQKLGYGGPAPPRGTHRYFFCSTRWTRCFRLIPGPPSRISLRRCAAIYLRKRKLFGSYGR